MTAEYASSMGSGFAVHGDGRLVALAIFRRLHKLVAALVGLTFALQHCCQRVGSQGYFQSSTCLGKFACLLCRSSYAMVKRVARPEVLSIHSVGVEQRGNRRPDQMNSGPPAVRILRAKRSPALKQDRPERDATDRKHDGRRARLELCPWIVSLSLDRPPRLFRAQESAKKSRRNLPVVSVRSGIESVSKRNRVVL